MQRLSGTVHTVGASSFERMPVGEVIAVVEQPIGAGFGQPTRFFPHGGKVNVAAIGDFFKTVFVNAAEAVLTVEKTALSVGEFDFAFNLKFVQAALATAVAQKFPLGAAHLL